MIAWLFDIIKGWRINKLSRGCSTRRKGTLTGGKKKTRRPSSSNPGSKISSLPTTSKKGIVSLRSNAITTLTSYIRPLFLLRSSQSIQNMNLWPSRYWLIINLKAISSHCCPKRKCSPWLESTYKSWASTITLRSNWSSTLSRGLLWVSSKIGQCSN